MQSRRQRSRIEKLRLDSLRVPPAGKAQRAFREAKSDRIAAEFDINSFGIPAVCRVNGTNWVVDGQHRVSGIQKCGYAKASDTIECEVYEGLSIAEMARMFLGRNRSTPVTPFERFAVAVTAGYPTEVAITKIVESLGLKVGYPKTDGNVYSVGALRRVYDRYGADTLELGRPQSSWTRIKGESDVTRRWGYGSVEAGEGSWVGADGGSPEGDRSRRRRGGDGVGGLGAGTTVEREPETGCGVAAAA